MVIMFGVRTERDCPNAVTCWSRRVLHADRP